VRYIYIKKVSKRLVLKFLKLKFEDCLRN